MFGKPRYNKEKGAALCYSSRIVVTKNYREFRINNDNTVPRGSVDRDSQVIVPRGFPYDVSKHPGGGCYFKYTSAEKVNGKIEPVYTLVTSGC